MRVTIATMVVTMLGGSKDAGAKPASASAAVHAAAGSASAAAGSAGSAASPSPAKLDVAPAQDAGVAAKQLGETVVSDERIGGLKIGSSAKVVIAALGKPKKQTKLGGSEATGDFTSAWSWPGVGISMVKTAHGFEVQSIAIKAPSMLATSRGIPDREPETQRREQLSALDRERQRRPEQLPRRLAYGGELFTFRDGKVSEIFLGQMAD
jgi:hypothetical protein